MSEAVNQHLARHIGEAEAHYAVYPGPSGFVHRIRPGSGRPWTTLYTEGMSARPLPDCDEGAAYIELVVRCPEGWFRDDAGGPISQVGSDDGDWLVELMQWMMQLPWRMDLPLFAGAVLPNGEPAEPYAEGVRFCSMLIAPVLCLPVDAQEVRDGDKTVRLLSMVLLDGSELELAERDGIEALYEALDAAGVTELVDPERPSAAG